MPLPCRGYRVCSGNHRVPFSAGARRFPEQRRGAGQITDTRTLPARRRHSTGPRSFDKSSEDTSTSASHSLTPHRTGPKTRPVGNPASGFFEWDRHSPELAQTTLFATEQPTMKKPFEVMASAGCVRTVVLHGPTASNVCASYCAYGCGLCRRRGQPRVGYGNSDRVGRR